MNHATKIAQKKAALTPPQIEAWRIFSRTVFKDGALDGKSKQLIAIAVAHVTQCPYCIKAHVPQALRKEASPQEIMEAIWLAAAVRASGAIVYAGLAIKVFEDHADVLEPEISSAMERKKERLAPKTMASWHTFNDAVFEAGALDEKTKQLIALAVAHVTQCAHSIRSHTSAAQLKGASQEQIMEAIWVASEMRAGAAYAHGSIAMEAMDPS